MSCLKMLAAAAVACALTPPSAMAQQAGSSAYGTGAVVLVPQSSIARPEDAGVKAHTNTMILVSPKSQEPPPASGVVVVVPGSSIAGAEGGGVKAHADAGASAQSKQTLPAPKLDDGAGPKD